MLAKLHFGAKESLSVNVPQDRLVAHLGATSGEPINVRVEMARALQQPIDFPPLTQAVVPGDKVAIALEPGLPQAEAIVETLAEVLVAAGIELRDITVVEGPIAAGNGPAHTLDDETAPATVPQQAMRPLQVAVRYEAHDPANQQQLAYLAADRKARPIYINRTLDEADLVIPVSLARGEAAYGYAGASTVLFPAFSDERRHRRLHAPQLLYSSSRREKLNAVANQVSWLLGVNFAVQVVPGPGESVVQVLAGNVQAVYRQALAACEHHWRQPDTMTADLVVATVGNPGAATAWDDVGRALFAALALVEPGGSIALVTNLATPPGPGVQLLTNCEDWEIVNQQLNEERPPDALAAAALAAALQNGPLYLLSRLPAKTVEDLGLAHLENSQQLERLLAQYPRCILLDNAQHALCASE